MARKKGLTQKRVLIAALIILAVGIALYRYYEPIRNFSFTTGEILP